MSRTFVRNLAAKAGMAPGTPVYVGEREGTPASLSLIEYSRSGCVEGRFQWRTSDLSERGPGWYG
jgi:hypothetical protein